MKRIATIVLTVMILAGMNTSLSYAFKPAENTEVVEEIISEEPLMEAAVEEEPLEEGNPIEGDPIEGDPIEDAPIEEKPIEESFLGEDSVGENSTEEDVIEELPMDENFVETNLIEENPLEEFVGEEASEEYGWEEFSEEIFDDGISLLAGFNDELSKTTMFIINKLDEETREQLSGAEFKILQWDKDKNDYVDNLEYSSKFYYSAAAKIYFSQELWYSEQNCGKFKIIETKAPQGYIGNYEAEFVLPAEEIIYLDVTNKKDRPSCGSISIQKRIREQDIIWEHGNPVFHFCVEGNDEKGTYRKYEDFLEFQKGNYAVDGEGYAILTCTFTDIPYGSYRVSERNPMRYTGERVSPVKGNVSIEGNSGMVILEEENKEAGMCFQNVKIRYDKFSHCDVVKNRLPITWK